MTTQNFINEIKGYVQKYPSGISESIRIAQAILESDKGQSVLAKEAKNLFGIKGSAPWNGPTYSKVSGEVFNGQYGDYRSDFRAYDSWEESIKDHAGFFTSTEYRENIAYKKALKATNYKDEANALTGVYATDHKYGSKLINIVETYNLTQYNTGNKVEDKKGNSMTKLRTPIKKHTLVNMGGKVNKIEYIVIHFVGAAGQALANANYFYNVYREASAHIFIDPNVTYEVVPENRVAWHVGDGRGKYGITNNNSLGIEGCQDTSTGKNVWEWQFHPNTYEQMLLQTSAWMDKYNVPINRVVRHYDASRKSCPGNWMANNWAKWHKFKKDLAELRKNGSIDVPNSNEATKYNPKGLQEVAIAAYREPTKEFIDLKVGDTATPRNPFNWYNPETKKYMISPNAPNYYGVADKVKEIKDVNIGYSKQAYLMENSMSWVLEQDLEEPRAHYENGNTASTYVVRKGDYLYKIAEEFNTTVDNIKKWNKLESNIIYVGMELFVVEPLDQVAEDEKPNSTDDRGDSDIIKDEEQPNDDGDKTVSIELEEGQFIDWLGNIYTRQEK